MKISLFFLECNTELGKKYTLCIKCLDPINFNFKMIKFLIYKRIYAIHLENLQTYSEKEFINTCLVF